MGMYDMLETPDGSAQVKLWDSNMDYYKPGDKVPDVVDFGSNYSIALREGGYANITDNVYVGWSETPMYDRIVDKYGDLFNTDSLSLLRGQFNGLDFGGGPFKDPYFF